MCKIARSRKDFKTVLNIVTRSAMCRRRNKKVRRCQPHLRAREHWPLCLATGGRVFVADPSTLGRHVAAKPNGKKIIQLNVHRNVWRYADKFHEIVLKYTKSLEINPNYDRIQQICLLQPQKRSVCGGDEPQPVAHLSHKLQCARQSLKIMVSYGNKYPRHNARPPVAKQSGQCARALRGVSKYLGYNRKIDIVYLH